jgi:SAM-dependent methyltransferase
VSRTIPSSRQAGAEPAGGNARERNLRVFGGPFGALYSYYMERDWLSRIIGHVVWGSDVRPYYRSMASIGEVPDGGLVVDAPCGAGVAFRGLHPRRNLRYLAFDLSPAMAERARRRAWARGLSQVEVSVADATDLPVADGSADLFLSYFGLHCFDDPQAALLEAARALRPGGRLVGSAIVRGDRLFDRLRAPSNRGALGKVGGEDELRAGLEQAGFAAIESERSGIFAFFRALAG